MGSSAAHIVTGLGFSHATDYRDGGRVRHFVADRPTANPILTSTQAVLAYAAAAGIQRAKRTRWDYEVESPLRDARGFDLGRSAGPPP